ncbi:MAG: Kelch repeat-containing protein [Anaerolineae bacterium]
MTVRADQDWQDTGIILQEGDFVTVSYVSGRWSPWSGHWIDAGGNPGSTDGANLIQGVPHAGLIGRIGQGQPFFIGREITFYAADSGILYLRINDKQIADNSGSIVAKIQIGSSEAGLKPEDYDWVRRTPSRSPSSRGNYAVAYDSRRKVIVLFGGSSGSTTFNDTWEWDGENWYEMRTQITPSGSWNAVMVYDPKRGVIVLFGGLDSSGHPHNETWEYDGNSWRKVETATSPSPRRESCAAYNSETGEVVLFGGNNGAGEFYGDTWVYDGTNWTLRTSSRAPSARSLCAMAYQPGQGTILLFGGGNNSASMSDTWEWTGNEWKELTPPTKPPARGGHTMVYHDRLGLVLMFGGDRGRCSTLYEDMWAWNGSTWNPLAPTRPGTHSVIASAYMPDRDAILLFGGWAGGNGICRVTSDTWEFIRQNR